MKVKDIMSAPVQTCRPDTDLATVAGLMWDHDCGVIPVIGSSGAVLGLITDRDICIASATRRLPPERISAAQAMSESVHACFPDDSTAAVLASMKQFKVRRLPVVDGNGDLKGIVSMNDLVRAANAHQGIPAKDVVATLSAICEPRTVVEA
jgi:CBS domain-containing protein